MQEIIFITLIFFGICGAAFFSGAETAVTSAMNRLKLRRMADEGNAEAKDLMRFFRKKEDILAVTLIGTNICNIMASVLATLLALRFSVVGAEILAVVILTPVILIHGEIIPKAIARHYAIPISMRIVPLLKFSLYFFSPLLAMTRKLSLSVLALEKSSEDFLATKEELKILIREGREQGVWDKKEHDIIQNIFDLEKTKTRKIMKQMARVKTLDPHMGIAELKAFARQTGYSMFPVYDKRARKVMGIVSIYDLIFSSEDITDIKSIMRPVLEVSPYKPIDDFLREMRTKRQAMAIVRDDKGRHVGVVTLEDILEEIVGEFE